ncbi:hypothetical protein D3C85_1547090 [compost metagenome]
MRQISRHRLHATEHHFAVALFTLQPGSEDIGLQTQRAVFGVVLRHQLFDVSQHQHAASRQSRQFGYHQAFTRPGGQDDGRRICVFAKPG